MRAKVSAKQSRAKKPDRHGFRGTPEPPKFSLAELPDDTLITETEAAGYLRVAKSTIAEWRLRPDHALKWIVLPGGFVRTTAGFLRAYMATGVRRRRTELIAARAVAEQSATERG